MQAIILAAGEGSRIRPLSETIPKPMLPIGDRPIAEHTAAAAVDAGVDELVFVIGEESTVVPDHFGSTFQGVPITYAVQETQCGTADALRAARGVIDGPFAVFNGDVLYDPGSVDRLLEEHPSIGTFRAETPSNYGILSVEDGRTTGIVEKPADPPSNLANAGAYVLPEQAAEWLDVSESERGEYELTDVLSQVIDHFDVTPIEFEYGIDVGRPWELLEANEQFLESIERDLAGTVSPDATIDGAVHVEPGATVESGAVIRGPTLIRSGATVGPGAYVRGSTVVGPDVHVGHAVEIKNSVLMAGTNVGHLSYVGDSVLGQNVNFGAGTNVANLRHDDEPVRLTVKGDRISTGRRKFGVVAGHGARTAINTSINAGVTLWCDARTTPGEVITRDR